MKSGGGSIAEKSMCVKVSECGSAIAAAWVMTNAAQDLAPDTILHKQWISKAEKHRGRRLEGDIHMSGKMAEECRRPKPHEQIVKQGLHPHPGPPKESMPKRRLMKKTPQAQTGYEEDQQLLPESWRRQWKAFESRQVQPPSQAARRQLTIEETLKMHQDRARAGSEGEERRHPEGDIEQKPEGATMKKLMGRNPDALH